MAEAFKKQQGSIDKEFLEENYPLNLDTGQEPMWKDYGKNGAKELAEEAFIKPLLAKCL